MKVRGSGGRKIGRPGAVDSEWKVGWWAVWSRWVMSMDVGCLDVWLFG